MIVSQQEIQEFCDRLVKEFNPDKAIFTNIGTPEEFNPLEIVYTRE